MSRARARVVLTLVLLVAPLPVVVPSLLHVGPAGAEALSSPSDPGTTATTTPGTTTTSTSTTTTTTTTTQDPGLTVPTLPPSSTTTPGETTTTTTPTDGGGDQEPVSEEPPPDPVIQIPGKPPKVLRPDPALVRRIITADVKAGQLKLNAATNVAAAAHAEVDRLVARQGLLTSEQAALGPQATEAVRRYESTRAMLRSVVIATYISGGATHTEQVAAGADPTDVSYQVDQIYAGAVEKAQTNAMGRFLQAREDVGRLASGAQLELDQLAAAMPTAQKAAADADAAVVAATDTLDVLKAGSPIAIGGFVFPVADPHNFVDTFGAPRLVGTPLAHTHQGNDIFAPKGTPLLACESGILTRIGTNSLGGLRLWIIGRSGTRYYYAHLVGYAQGITEGMPVEAGTVVGYVGNTGDAVGAPPHLHFEIHPGAGPAIDPYTILAIADIATRRARQR